MEFLGKLNIDFIGKRKFTFLVSGIVAVVGIIGIVQIARNAANMGIDFSGGTSVQLRFQQPIATEKARAILVKHDLKEAQLQEITDGNKLLIKIGKTHLQGRPVTEAIKDAFQKELPGVSFELENASEIGPSIGDKLKKDTLTAVAISMIGIIIYIAWRFDFKFGVGAVLATLHDVLAMIAVFYLLDKEINLLFVTAVLTIAGYSLTDTVVVFDRIRENLIKNHVDPVDIVFNSSINEVMSRTIITSLTTFLAASALLFFGGEVIHDFALALVVGILVATYSSIFIASPLVVEWQIRSSDRRTPDQFKAPAPPR